MTPRRRPLRGLALIEALVALAIVAIVAAITLPVLANAREGARISTCDGNLRQLGLALQIYAQDSDDRRPLSEAANPYTDGRVTGNFGWAGRLYPYARSAAVFHCPDDPTPGDTSGGLARAPVSYAENSNLAALASGDAGLTSPVRTVALFEVQGDPVALTAPDEGSAARTQPTMSAAGDGVNGALASLTGFGGDRPPRQQRARDSLADQPVPPGSGPPRGRIALRLPHPRARRAGRLSLRRGSGARRPPADVQRTLASVGPRKRGTVSTGGP